MKKGTTVIYNNKLYKVWRKEHNHVIIYEPGAALPELTMISCSINKVKRV